MMISISMPITATMMRASTPIARQPAQPVPQHKSMRSFPETAATRGDILREGVDRRIEDLLYTVRCLDSRAWRAYCAWQTEPGERRNSQ